MTGLLLLAQEAENGQGLTAAGTVMMLLSVGLVLALNGFCMSRILFGKQRDPESR